MKANSLKSIVILVAILGTISTANASLLTSISTEVSGGIAGNEVTIKPIIEFGTESTIFNQLTISQDQVGQEFTISSDMDDNNFSAFVEQLTNQKNQLLKVGHEIGFVKGNLGNLESTWFGSNLIGKKITRITLRYDLIEFKSTGSGKKWTNFMYKITLSFYDDAPTMYMDLVDDSYSQEEILNGNNTTKGEEEETLKGATRAFDSFDIETKSIESKNVTSDQYIMNINKVTTTSNSEEKKTKINSEKKTHQKAIANYLIRNIHNIFSPQKQ